MEKSVFIWYLPRFIEQLAALVNALKRIGVGRALVKAGVDGDGINVAWIEGEARGTAAPQWGSRTHALALAGIECIPWYFVYGLSDLAEWGAILRSLWRFGADEIVLNVESGDGAIWATASDERVGEYVEGLRAFLAAHGFTPLIGFSSVPSWTGRQSLYFPYEAFVQHCDGGNYPQVYWPLDVVDELFWSNQRTIGDGERVIPILPLGPRELIADLARAALDRIPNLAGFSYWEAGNAGADFDALGEAFVLMQGVELAVQLRKVYTETEIRTAIGKWWQDQPAWARGIPTAIRNWRADFTAIDPRLTSEAWGFSWEFGDVWGDASGDLHLVQPELSARVRALAVTI